MKRALPDFSRTAEPFEGFMPLNDGLFDEFENEPPDPFEGLGIEKE
jgi:hypothetical protein